MATRASRWLVFARVACAPPVPLRWWEREAIEEARALAARGGATKAKATNGGRG